MVFTKLDINFVTPTEGLRQKRQKWYVPDIKNLFTLPRRVEDSDPSLMSSSQTSIEPVRKRDLKHALKEVRLFKQGGELDLSKITQKNTTKNSETVSELIKLLMEANRGLQN